MIPDKVSVLLEMTEALWSCQCGLSIRRIHTYCFDRVIRAQRAIILAVLAFLPHGVDIGRWNSGEQEENGEGVMSKPQQKGRYLSAM